MSCFYWDVSLVVYSEVLVWCCALGPLLRSEMEGDRPPPLRRYPSVLDMGKMVAVKYEKEAEFFHQRLILRTAPTAAMLNTTGRMCDSPNGLFWILTPDGDVHPKLLAPGIIWLNETNEPIPTTMMPAGRNLEQVFSELTGAFCSLQKSSCERFSEPKRRRTLAGRVGVQGSAPPATPDTPLGQKVDEGDSLDPGDTVADPLLDARVLSVQRNSPGDRHREFRNAVSELVQISLDWMACVRPSYLRTFLWCCTSMSEHALHPLAHHSRFVQPSGLLPTDPAAQEHELLCRAIKIGFTFDQLQGAELSCFELLARMLQMLEMKL